MQVFQRIQLFFCCIVSIVCCSIDGAEPFYIHSEFQKNAQIKNDALYKSADEDYVKFWEKCAEEIDWYSKWDRALEWNSPYAKWFETGTLNVSYNCLDRHIARGKGDKVSLIYVNEIGTKRNITYSQLSEEVNKVANTLKKLGVQRGDRVAIYMPMTPEAIASMLACTRIGAVHLVIFGGMGASAVKDRVLESEAKVIITADGSYRSGKIISFKTQIDQVLDECPSVKKVLVLKHTNSPVDMKEGRDVGYNDEVSTSSSICAPEKMGAEDPLFILYTSGTTGKPKGLLHTTGGYLVGIHNTFKWIFDIKPTDVYWCTADIGWITGHSYVAYAPLSHGATQVIYEGSFDFPTKNQFGKIIDEHGVSIFYTAPTLIRMFMKWGDECLASAKLNSLRLLGTVGETINPDTWVWFYKNIGHEKCPIVDTWWQTETGAVVVAPIPGITPLTPGSATKALPGYKVDILDEDGNSASKGYLAILKPFPSMMRGIYKDPERYKSTYWSKWDGKYYFPGDYASFDENGYLWLGGRCDEVLKVSGHRIGTAEVENALIQHQMVAESAVCGIYDAIKGEKIIAFVILKDGSQSKDIETELRKTVAAQLGSYAAPAKIVVVDKLPKTKSGKILRRVLKNLTESKDLGNISTLNDPSCLDELREICMKVHRELGQAEVQKGQDCTFVEVSASNKDVCAVITEVFKNTIEPIYGPQEKVLEKIQNGSDRKGYVMYDGSVPVGVIVYKIAPNREIAHLNYDNSLEVKSLFVINAKNNSGKGYGSKLVDKVVSIAQELKADSLFLTVSQQVPESLEFFQKKKFVIIKEDAKHHETGNKEYTLVRKVA